MKRELSTRRAPARDQLGLRGRRPGFLSRHEKQGTREPSAYLTVPEALEWQRTHDWGTVRERCHELARRARNELGLEPIAPDAPDFYRQMVSLRLPHTTRDDLQERLYDEHRIEIPTFERDGGRLIRASFAGYNDAEDLERLKAALAVLL